jgi:hypothetical protein
MSEPIRGGYYLKARCIEQSDVAHAPPHVRELWDYLLRVAFWQDGDKLRRGQVLTCCPEIQEALHWKIGWRKERYSSAQIETGMKTLRKAGMITTRRTTRGVVVTVCNYERFQTPDNYDNRTENRNDRRNDNRNENRPIDKEGKIKKGDNTSTPGPEGFPHDLFARFQKAHPSCEHIRDFQFQTALAAVPGADVAEAVEAFERQLAGAGRLNNPPIREFEKYLRRSVGKKDGGREFPQKNAAPFSADEEQHRAAIRARLSQRPAGEVSQAERMKQKAEEIARKQREASTHEESEE